MLLLEQALMDRGELPKPNAAIEAVQGGVLQYVRVLIMRCATAAGAMPAILEGNHAPVRMIPLRLPQSVMNEVLNDTILTLYATAAGCCESRFCKKTE
jgi:hypothetical protein